MYLDAEVFVLKGKNNSSKVCLSSCPQHKKGFPQQCILSPCLINELLYLLSVVFAH